MIVMNESDTGFNDKPRQGTIVFTRECEDRKDPKYGDAISGCGKEGNPINGEDEGIQGRKVQGSE